MSLPLIAVIGRVSYQNSVSDLAVYGATRDYLKYSLSSLPKELYLKVTLLHLMLIKLKVTQKMKDSKNMAKRLKMLL
jgi:hypothetical protein